MNLGIISSQITTPVTATPTPTITYFSDLIRLRIQNNDSDPATIYLDQNNPPTTSRRLINPGSLTLNLNVTVGSAWYYYAVAVGKEPSPINSIVIQDQAN